MRSTDLFGVSVLRVLDFVSNQGKNQGGGVPIEHE